MKSVFKKIFLVIMCIFILVYVGFQIFQLVSSNYTTEVALEYTIQNKVYLEGIVIRAEKVIDYEKDGIVHYQYNNGDKVASGSTVANIYNNQNDVTAIQKVEQIESQIQLLESSQDQEALHDMQMDGLIAQTDKDYASFMEAVVSEDLSSVHKYKENILLQMNRRQILSETTTSFQALIDQLKAEKSSLETSLNTQPTEVTVQDTGYFSDVIDGYEEELNFDTINSITGNQLSGLLENTKKTESNNIGKLVTSFSWKYIAFVSTKDMEQMHQSNDLYVGASLTLQVDGYGNTISGVVEEIRSSSTDDKKILVIQSNVMNKNIINLRKVHADILLQEVTGIKIDKEAYRIVQDENGEMQKGVYIMYGKQVVFKKIEVLQETDEYVIAKLHTDETDYLQVYDNVIIKGKEIYDHAASE